MTLAEFWRAFLTRMEIWSSEAFRHRRAQLVPRSKPTYDAYPGEHDEPEMKFYIEARDVRGRLLREYVYLEGYSVNQINLRKRGAMRGNQLVWEWFIERVIQCQTRLTQRLDEVREVKEGTPRKPFDPRA